MQRLFSIALSAALLLGPALASWAQEDKAPPLAETDFSVALFKMLGGLALVLGILVGLYWLTRRFMPGGAIAGPGGNMRILGRLPMGQRKQLALVEVADRVLVLGVTQDDIRMLDKVTEAGEIEKLRQNQGPGEGFAKVLKKVSSRGDES